MNSEREKNIRQICERIFFQDSTRFSLSVSPITGVICKLYFPSSSLSSPPGSPPISTTSSSSSASPTTSASVSVPLASQVPTHGKWLTGRILFGQVQNNCAYVYFEQNSCRWIDFSANSSDAVLFTTDQVIHLPGSFLARKFRGSIQGLTKMGCFNDGVYIEYFPPKNTPMVVSAADLKPFNIAHKETLEPSLLAALNRELTYITHIRQLVSSFFNQAPAILLPNLPNIASSSAQKMSSISAVLTSEPTKTKPTELSLSSHLAEQKTNKHTENLPVELRVNQPSLNSHYSNVNQVYPGVFYGPRPTSNLAHQTNSLPFSPQPVFPPSRYCLYPGFAVPPRSTPHRTSNGRFASPQPNISTRTPLPRSMYSPMNSLATSSLAASSSPPVSPLLSSPPELSDSPPRYEILHDPLPNWKKVIIIPGWDSNQEWIGNPLTKFLPPGTDIPLEQKEDVVKFFNQIHPDKIEEYLALFDFREVFCLCHKPEISEVITYMECLANIAGCNRWFHPECAGWDRYELDQYEDDLICPLCTDYLEKNQALNRVIEERPFRVMRLKVYGLCYFTDEAGLLPERKMIKAQISQQIPKVIQQGSLEFHSYSRPHRVWGIGGGQLSFTRQNLVLTPHMVLSHKEEKSTVQNTSSTETRKLSDSKLLSLSLSRLLDSATKSAQSKSAIALPWVQSDQTPTLSEEQLREDIRVATQVGKSGTKSLLYTSIRGGWKLPPGVGDPTSETSSKSTLSPESQEPTVTITLEEQKPESVIIPSPIEHAPMVNFPSTSGPIPGVLLPLIEYCQNHCAFCFEPLPDSYEILESPALGVNGSRKRPRDNEENSLVRGYQVHSLCRNLLFSNYCETILQSTPSSKLIVIKGLSSLLNSQRISNQVKTENEKYEIQELCILCGRSGGLLFSFQIRSGCSQFLSCKSIQHYYHGHGLCLRSLAISGLLCQPPSITSHLPLSCLMHPISNLRISVFDEIFQKFHCSVCGQKCGLTYPCAEVTCHARAHHICAKQSGWRIGMNGNSQCFFCTFHPFR